MEQEYMQEAPENAGRGGDTVMAHLSLGELVIPRAFLDEPQVMEMMQALFQDAGANINQYMVGDPANSINPETGYPEFGFGSFFKKVAKIAIPAALAYFAPGIGTALGATAGSAGAYGLGGAVAGGAGGLLSGGGLKGALTGAALGGAGGYIGGGGINDTLVGRSVNSLSNSVGAGNVFGSSLGTTQPALAPLSSTAATGAAGASAGGGSSFSGLGLAANALGGLSQEAAIKKQQKDLLAANNQQLANLETFNPADITKQPNYQFNLEQGQLGLNKQLAASGALGSGRAIKAATEYNQNYAGNAFQQAYQNWLQKVGAQNQLIGGAGDVRANATGAGAQNLAQSLSNAIGSPVGQYGQGMTLEQLRRMGMAV